ncbi:acyltransferase family protein [Roseibacillus persicicus]|uniref:Acyltransferase 3 domain-containing protein n=1 Tax=Roseibacillus persicicus TaxID=454148 RepID=A0A918WN69_9BACT|nr:acyltransferase [Roseibacillus persicicus]GHC58770.1 hypothetical protein GCM10007100_27300 [Roseibacillus persicicus]
MKTYYHSLDGLRALAVGVVLIAHAGSPFPRSGSVGVEIFFVLSGFLITGILSREFQESGAVSRKNFYIRRLLRLTPALLLAVALFAVLFSLTHHYFPTREVAIALTYTANWAEALWNLDLGAMAHCWTLATEEQFYFLWPFVIVALEKTIKTTKGKALALTTIALALAGYRAAVVGSYSPARIYFGLDTHMDGLVMGSALAYFAAILRTSEKSRSTSYHILSWIVVPVSLFVLLALMYLFKWDSTGLHQYGFFLAALSSVAIILDLTLSPFSLIQKPLSLPPLVYLGKISYGLYLFHYPLYHFITEVMPDASFLVKAPLKIGLSILVAALSFHLVEVKFLTLKKHFAKGKNATE